MNPDRPTLLTHGYELLHGGYGPELVRAIDLVEKTKCPPGESVFVENVMGCFPYQDLVRLPVIVQRVTEILKADPMVYYSHVTVVAPGGVAQTGNYHLDRMPLIGRGIKVAFYLTDCLTDENAPIRIVPGSWDSKDQPFKSEGVNLYASRGDILLTRPDMWHRSTQNTGTHTRRSLFASYCVLQPSW